METLWTKERVITKLHEINEKGYISVPKGMFRTDDGIVGQILEREFGVSENNLHLADLGNYELKGMRNKHGKPNMLTLFHQTSTSGMTPIQIFDEFGYIRKSNRNGVLKKKLFTTIKGSGINSLGLILKANAENEIYLYHGNRYLATWDLSVAKQKIDQVILVFADTKGPTNSPTEQFHYVKGYILSNPKPMDEAIRSGAVVMDLCIDQPADKSKGVHDRGPHIRIPVSKLSFLFNSVEQVL